MIGSMDLEMDDLCEFPAIEDKHFSDAPHFMKSWRVGYLEYVHPDGCACSYLGESVGQATVIVHFSMVIHTLVPWEFCPAARGDEVFQEKGSRICMYVSVSSEHSLWVIH